MKKIKVLYFITGLQAGGAERMLEKIIRNIDKKKFEVSVCSLTKGGEIYSSLIKKGMKVQSLGINHSYQFFSAVSKARKIIKSQNPDILHCFMHHANIIGRFAAVGLKCKVISSIRGKTITSKFQNFLDRMTQFLVNVYTVNSQALKKFVLISGIKKNKLVVIENGIELKSLKPGKSIERIRKELRLKDMPVLASIANIRPIKDYPTLIKAVGIVQKKIYVNLLIVGTGKEKDIIKTKELAKSLGVNNILFLGYRKDIPDILAITDVWVSSTLSEGQSNSLLEAMAMKKAIVTTNIPENAEVARDGKEALLVPVKSPEKMADAIIRLLKNRKFAGKLGENAQKRVKDYYSIKKSVAKTEKLYKKLI